jgi:hypothetical protein
MSTNHAAANPVRNVQNQQAVIRRQQEAKRSDRRAALKDRRSI